MVQQNNPLLSVCMIAYQVGPYIQEAIEGVLMQECDFEFELIISNDNSQDKTEEIIFKMIHNHPMGHIIRYKKQERNIGSTLNYLWCLENAKGDFVSICDSDDFWIDKLKLQKQVDFLIKTDFIGSFHDRFQIEEDGRISSNSLIDEFKRNWNLTDFIKSMPEVPTASLVFKKNNNFTLPDQFKEVKVNGDTFLLVYLLHFGDLYYDSSIQKSAYRRHSTGLWSSLESSERCKLSLKTYELLKQAFPENNDLKHQHFEIRNLVYFYSLKSGNTKDFIYHLSLNFVRSFSKVAYFNSFWKFISNVLKYKFNH